VLSALALPFALASVPEVFGLVVAHVLFAAGWAVPLIFTAPAPGCTWPAGASVAALRNCTRLY